MIKNSIWLIFLLVSVETDVSQSKSNARPFQVWVDKTTGPTVNGILHQVTQDHIQVVPGFYANQPISGDSHQLSIQSQEIQQLRLRRKGSVGRGIWIGAVAGVVTGVIIGLASGDDPDCGYDPNNPSPFGHVLGSLCESMHMTAGEKAALSGVGLGLAGGLVGGIIGSIKIKIPINGSQNIFEANQARLRDYAVGN